MRQLAVVILTMTAWCAASEPARDRLRLLGETARALPPEYAADLLLRLAAAASTREPARKAELYEAAFQAGAQAGVPLPRRAAFAVLPDGDIRYQSLGAALRLDRLSIQARAVQGLLKLRPARARELFEQIPAPSVSKVTCAEALVPDPSVYYETLARVVELAYTPAEKARQDHLSTLQAAVQGASSSVQLAALARLLVEARLPAEHKELLATALAGRLAAVNDDDRTYTVALRDLSLAGRVRSLGAQAGATAAALDEALKGLAGRQQKGVHCQGVLMDEVIKTPAGDMIVAANPNSDEKMPDKPELALHVRAYPQTEEGRALGTRIRGLWITPDGQMYRPDQKGTEWQAKAIDALAAVDAWEPARSGRVTDQLHERLVLYRGILQSGLNDEMQKKVLISYVAALAASPAQTECPAEWLVELHTLLDMIRMPAGVNPPPGALREAMLAELAQGRSPVTAAYAAMEADHPVGTAGWRNLEPAMGPRQQ
jgi:hypothetical protein